MRFARKSKALGQAPSGATKNFELERILMTTSRRNFFKAAGALAGAAVVPGTSAFAKPAKAAAETAKNAPRILKGGVEVGAPLPGFEDFDLTETFAPGKSTLNDGVVMNASHWGIGRVHVKGGRIQRIEPFEKDQSPSATPAISSGAF